jgi:CRISPR-associated protein Cmr2
MAPGTWWSVGLTPVQSWISEARRSRDLLVGSRLLAWTMGQLLVRLKGRGAEVWLPQVEDGDLSTVSDKLPESFSGSTATTNHASGFLPRPLEEAEALFGELAGWLASGWEELQREVAVATGRSAPELWGFIAGEIGRPRCPLQVVWALKEASEGVEAARGLEEVEIVYAAVKRSRPVEEHVGGGRVRKCGQCGRREAMGGPDPVRWRRFQDGLAALPEVKQGLRFEAGEYLCPVCALRRLAGYLQEEAFPSTSEIAASHWLWRLRGAPDLQEALEALDKAAGRVPGYDKRWADRAPLFYRRSIERERRRARQDGDPRAVQALEEVQGALGRLEAEIREHNRRGTKEEALLPERPPEYLAVVTFDGDDFGAKLRQELDVLPAQAAEFQSRLAAYFVDSNAAHPPRGRPFYLGGDEGLVLAPLAVALDLARGVKGIWDDTAGSTKAQATMSMGIALFDRERPLGAAIETARRALARAKRLRRPRKDGLAVSVQTASGSEWMAVAHWGGESWQRAAAALELLREGALAAGWPHDVERFLRTVSLEAFRGDEGSRGALREEVKRLSFRRTLQTARRAEVWQRLRGDGWWREQPGEGELETLADSLHLVAFLARQSGSLPGASGEEEGA